MTRFVIKFSRLAIGGADKLIIISFSSHFFLLLLAQIRWEHFASESPADESLC